MSDRRDPAAAPGGWGRTLLRCILPCDAMRDSILGDLHEEYVRDVAGLGHDRARARYRDRVLGIFAHAAWDTLRWRTWASTPVEGDSGSVGDERRGRTRDAAGGEFALPRPAGFGGTIGFAVLGVAVLVIGIVVNTSVFAAVEASTTGPQAALAASPGGGLPGALLVVLLGIGSVVLLLACAAGAAFLICLGPRWRSKRGRDGRAGPSDRARR